MSELENIDIEPEPRHERTGARFLRFLSFFLIVMAGFTIVEAYFILSEPQKWLLFSAPWEGSLGFQRLAHLAMAMVPVLPIVLSAIVGMEIDRLVLRLVLGRNSCLDRVSFFSIWLLMFLGGPLAASRPFPENSPTMFLSQHPLAVAIVAALLAVLSHATLSHIIRNLRSSVFLSWAISFSGSLTGLAVILANIYLLPRMLSPISLACTAIIIISGFVLFVLLKRISGDGLEVVLGNLSNFFLSKPLRPAVVLGGLMAAMLFSGAVWSDRGAKGSEDLPNVILITVDTLRYDHMSLYGYFLKTTPELDRFAEGGTVFEQCMSTAPQTVPSLASIMTSKYPSFHSAGTSNGLHAMLLDEATLAKVLQKNGYYCAAFVSNYVLSHKLQMFGGFEIYDDTFTSMEYARSVPERDAARTTEYAINWLNTAANDRFYLWVHYQDPHGPYTPPASLANRFAETDYTDAGRPSYFAQDVAREKIPDYQYIEGHSALSFYLSRYDAEIAYADENIGKLLNRIKALGLWEKSIIVFAADHGESMGEHGNYFKHGEDLTEELIHVPLIIRVPSIEHIKRVGDLVSTVDIAPTILDALGLQKELESTGLSLLPLVRGETARLSRDYITAEDDNGRLCLRSRQTKYIAGPGEERLYDLVNDHSETTNIVKKEPDRAASWRERTNAYRAKIVQRKGDVLHYSREDIERLKALGYVN